jgi:histidine ammonia-lyase
MVPAAQQLARDGGVAGLTQKVAGTRGAGDADALAKDVEALRAQLVDAGELGPGPLVAAAHARIRKDIAFLDADRAMDRDVARAIDLVDRGEVLEAARLAMGPSA